MTLLIESLDLTLSNKTIVKNVNLNVKPGEVVGLLGPNGAGKTSTFNMIVGLIKPSKGNIYLEMDNIKNFSMTKRVQLGIGYLPQEPSVFRNLTVSENLDIALAQANLSISLFRKKREELIEEFNLVSFLYRFGHQLSGGERRRCEVARALAVGRVVDDLSLMTNRQFDEMFRRVSHKPRRVDTKLNAMLSIIRQQQGRTNTK